MLASAPLLLASDVACRLPIRTGAGTYDGAFSQHEHMDDGIYTKKKVRTEAETRRPILTSPPKKGGPGFPGRTLGPDPEFKADTYGEMETRLRVRCCAATSRA